LYEFVVFQNNLARHAILTSALATTSPIS
jgi:hypothetical protein